MYTYIDICFAGVGPITVAYTDSIKDLKDFYKSVNDLTAYGGGDYSEYALKAMLEGLLVQEELDKNFWTEVVVPGSQMIVITDARSKEPELKKDVIDEANKKSCCIHFFISSSRALNDGIYQEITNQTSGTLIYPYSSWNISTFIQSYRDRPCRHIGEEKRRKRQAPDIPSQCQSFRVTEFSQLLKLTIHALTGQIVTITKPNNTIKSVRVESQSLALLSEASPTPGQWKACVTTGTVQVFSTQSISLDTTVIYINSNNDSSSLPPSSCKKYNRP